MRFVFLIMTGKRVFWLQLCIQLLDRLHLGSLHVRSSHSTLAHRYLAEKKMDVLHSALSRGMSRYNWTLSPVLWPTQTRYLSATCLLYVQIKTMISSTNGFIIHADMSCPLVTWLSVLCDFFWRIDFRISRISKSDRLYRWDRWFLSVYDCECWPMYNTPDVCLCRSSRYLACEFHERSLI